jgi:hypothetical protein
VIQPVLHLHVCANPTATGADSDAEPLHSVADYTATSAAAAALTKTS